MSLDQTDDRFWMSQPSVTKDSNDDLPAEVLDLESKD